MLILFLLIVYLRPNQLFAQTTSHGLFFIGLASAGQRVGVGGPLPQLLLCYIMVKNPPATQETRVQSLGQEDPLERGMATHSSILSWEIPWTEEPGWLQSMGS